MKRTIARLLRTAVAVIFVLQMLPMGWVTAVAPSDLTGEKYLVVHGTDYPEPAQRSSLKITQADGAPISPESDGSYKDIPVGAKIVLNYAFHLEDGDDASGELYEYDGSEFFTAELPKGLNFAHTSGTVEATDSTGGYDYILALWSISGNTLKVELTNDSEDTSGYGGVANPDHKNKWGNIHIEGSFQALSPGGDDETSITFGSDTIIIRRQPLPTKSRLKKGGSYNASTNRITWTVTITPPESDPDMSYAGYSLIDQFGPGQAYVAGSFTVGEGIPPTSVTTVEDDPSGADPAKLDTSDLSSRIITYTFPDITGPLTVAYQTAPTDFSGEDGTPDYSEFENTASLKRSGDGADAADPVTGSVNLDWIEKAGKAAATEEDPTIAEWTVTVTVQGESGRSVSGAQIVDHLHPDLQLLADADHPVKIKFGSAAAVEVESGGGHLLVRGRQTHGRDSGRADLLHAGEGFGPRPLPERQQRHSLQ